MDPGRAAAAVVIAVIGLCFLIGFFRAFRERVYLALLGFSFWSLAGAIVIRSRQLATLKVGLLALGAVFFIGAAFFAIQQTLAQMRLIREHRAGLEREMWEYLEQLKRRAAEQGAESSSPRGPEVSGGGDE
jgi:hypothetical protein